MVPIFSKLNLFKILIFFLNKIAKSLDFENLHHFWTKISSEFSDNRELQPMPEPL